MRTTGKRAFCMTLVVLLVISFLISASFIIFHTDHDCTGMDCAVCTLLRVCEKTIRALMALFTSAAATILCSRVFLCCGAAFSDFRLSQTLIVLKVKLSN